MVSNQQGHIIQLVQEQDRVSLAIIVFIAILFCKLFAEVNHMAFFIPVNGLNMFLVLEQIRNISKEAFGSRHDRYALFLIE